MFSKKSENERKDSETPKESAREEGTPLLTPALEKTTSKASKDGRKGSVRVEDVSKDSSFKRKNSVLSKISKKEAPSEGIKRKNKTYSKEKQAFMREYFTNTPGLTKD